MRTKALQTTTTSVAKMNKEEFFTDATTSYNRKSITTAKKRNFLDAMVRTLGVVSKAATMCRTSKFCHYDWMKKDPAYKEAVESINNTCIDFAETKLFEKIDAGDTYSIIFYLKTKGKQRGYVEKDDIRSATQNNIVVNVAIPTGI